MKKNLLVRLLVFCFISVLTPLKGQYVQTAGKVILDGNGDTLLIRSMGVGG